MTDKQQLDSDSTVERSDRKYELSRCLEIGTLHGVSTSYIAAAIQPLNGYLTTIDLPWTANLDPSVENLLDDLNLTETVVVLREKAQAGAGWVMMEWLELPAPPVIVPSTAMTTQSTPL